MKGHNFKKNDLKKIQKIHALSLSVKNSLKKNSRYTDENLLSYASWKKSQNFTRKSEKTPKNGEKWQKSRNFFFIRETHQYLPPFSPRMILYTSLVQKISF